MKCRYCKAEIPEGELYCKKCGREVQIVPDYNPLEEMLTAQIQLDGNKQESELDQYINQKRRNNNRTGQTAGRNTGSTGRMLTEKERRKRQSAKAARKKALRRKRRIVLLIMALIVVLAGAGFYVIYQNSYNGIMKKAQKAAQSKDYTTAEAYYKQAISKNTKKADAYTGLADVYLLQDKTDEGTTLFEEAVSKQSGNVELYKTSGHWDHYKENMFPMMKVDDEEFVLRPMNCPHHMLIFKNKMHSYRDLPIRIGEFATDFRYEASGAVKGLERVRCMCQNDAHLFVTPEQIGEEFKKVVKLILDVYHDFGIENYKFRLSLRDKTR